MALISCPTCGKEISDKAQSCPSCGTSFQTGNTQPAEHICAECGTTFSNNENVCPQCGCPITTIENEAPQKVELASVSVAVKHTTKKRIIIVAVALLAIICSIFGFKYYQSIQEEKQLIADTEQYITNLELVSYDMLTGAAIAESAGSLTKQVWHDCIYEEYNYETYKYVKENGDYFGDYLDDFNDALSNLFNDDDFKQKISYIEENQETVASLMKELKNPPAGYEEAYDALKTFYNEYLAFTNLVISPSGSLTTFSSNFNNADSATLNAYHALEIYLNDIY